jgi:hypothetical protein
MSRDDDIIKFNKERDALFKNPTVESAKALLAKQGIVGFARDDVPLATVHKARLQWLEVTDDQIKESLAWLNQHGYEFTMMGAPPLTPERRDADRVAIGKKPLGEENGNK